MPTTRARSTWSGGLALLLALLVVLSCLSACSVLDGDDDSAPPVASPDATAEVRTLLTRHARALRAGEMTAFLDDVDEAKKPFAARQKRYFLNLRQLPLAKFGWRVPANSVTETEDGLRAVVELRMQLKRYDAAPVLTPQALTSPAPTTALKLAGDRDPEFNDRYGVELAPWDLMRIDVEEGDGVLGIFDAKSVDAAYQIIGSVERGIDAIDAEVPLDWSNRVVVYALSDIRPLAQLDNLPGGDPDKLDGVAFPVRAGPADPSAREHPLHAASADDLPQRPDPRPADPARADPRGARAARRQGADLALGGHRGVRLGPADRDVPPDDRQGRPPSTPRPGSTGCRGTRRSTARTPARTTGSRGTPASTSPRRTARTRCGGSSTRCAPRAARGEKGQDKVIRDVLGISGDQLADAAAQKIVNTFG